MIRKKRHIPMKWLKTDAMLRRIPLEHPKRRDIEQDHLRLTAGYKGEQSLDYHLNFLSHDKFLILHDLRLHDKIHYFQLDTLILHPSFFLIIEVKNFSGTLYFDSLFDQMIRTKNGVEEAFPDPVRQANRQASQFGRWLKNHKRESPTVESVVVVVNSASLLKTSSGSQTYSDHVIRDTRLVETIENLTKRHREKIFSIAELRKLASLLVRNDTPLNPDVLTRYGVSPSELTAGVYCPSCGRFAMERAWGKWLCPHCDHSSKDAHVGALRDYGLLVAPTITNREARDFLRLDSPMIAKYLLHSLNVRYVGTNKGRRYDLTQLSK